MMPIEIDPAYGAGEETDRITNLCWLAHEVHAAYMEEGTPLLESVDDEEEVDENSPIVHDTTPVPLSQSTLITLSNLAYVSRPDGVLVPFPAPGIVALRVERTDETNGLPLEPIDQIVFRLPAPECPKGEIFDGYELVDEARIPEEAWRRLSRLQRVLTCTRFALRNLATYDDEAYAQMYHATVPWPAHATAEAVDMLLEDLFGNRD